jgi:hypothetical protein
MAKQSRKPVPKSQRELSISEQKAFDQRVGNPNYATEPSSARINQISAKDSNIKPFSVNIQDIDEAVFYYLQNVIKPFVIQNGTRLEVPVIYGSPEKWKAYQKDGYYRDLKNAVMAPLIMFRRTSIEKNRTIGNKLDANQPNNYGVFTKKYSPRNAYSNFDVLNQKTPEKQLIATVIPDYLTVNYDFVIFTYYVEQLNKIVESIEYASDSYWGDPERYKFRAMIDSFGFQTELTQDNERIVRSTFSVKLNGYIIPDTIQKNATALTQFIDKTQIIISQEVTTTNLDSLK